MKTYTIRLHHEQLQYLYNNLAEMFADTFILDKIDHYTYYNIRSFIKTLHTKLFQLNDKNVNKQRTFNTSIDINQYKHLKEWYALYKESINNNVYLQIIYYEIFAQCDKQEMDLMDRHKYISTPAAIVQHKIRRELSNE